MKPGSWTFADPMDPEWVHETFDIKNKLFKQQRNFMVIFS